MRELDASLEGGGPRSIAARGALNLDRESLRLVESSTTSSFRAGANLSDADKEQLKKLNGKSTLSMISRPSCWRHQGRRLRGPARTALAGLSDRTAAAAQAAAGRQFRAMDPAPEHHAAAGARVLEPAVDAGGPVSMSVGRAERGEAHDTRPSLQAGAAFPPSGAKLLDLPARRMEAEDQNGEDAAGALRFMDALVPVATAQRRARRPISSP